MAMKKSKIKKPVKPQAKKAAAKKTAEKKKAAKPRASSPKVRKVVSRNSVPKPKAKNRALTNARAAKEDEFYTQLADIERELANYRDHFAGKVVYCNCDDPRVSGFVHYFSYNFERLKLKKLIATCYKNQNMDLFSQHDSERAVKLVYTGDKNGSGVPDQSEFDVELLDGDGDFRSSESMELLKEADIVVTNPPFSLFREFVAQILEHEKKFLIVGSQNAITYKEMFPLIRDNKLWLGYLNGDMKFRVPDYYEERETRFWIDDMGKKWRSFGNACWFTNLDIAIRHENLVLYKTFSPEEFPEFDYYKAIEVKRTTDIPNDYTGVMGVPITFLSKHNSDQFEIIDANTVRKSESVPVKAHGLVKDKEAAVAGKVSYVRILIRKKQSV